ncbi:MAG: hypothetical protein PHY02_01305 [Phycisphaerae bacterium]|nr:hypothetical protein [Phycisphaerae bacterium]
MNNTANKKEPLSWWRRALLAMVLIVMALLTFLILADYLAEKQLGDEIIKISQAGEPITFLDLQAGFNQSSEGEDAAAYYEEGLFNLLRGDLGNLSKVNTFYRKSIISLPANQFPGEIKEKVAQSLATLQPVLEKFDKAGALPLSRFDIGIEQGMKVCRTSLNCAQTAAFLLSLRTLHLVMQGEDDAAVDSAITMLKMTRILDSCPTMILHTAKAVFVAYACEDIHLLLEHAHPSEKSLARLQEALSQTMPANSLERMFFAERVYQLERAKNLIPDNIASRFLQDKVADLPEQFSLPSSRWGRLRVRRKSAQYLRDMAELIAVAQRPWPGPLDDTVANLPLPARKPGELLSSGAVFIRLTAETVALVRCSILAIAVERYQRQHGELPIALEDLCPAYIDSLPLDPFTGKKLLFSRDEETYAVYSVGANRLDDGGSTMRQADESGPQDFGLRIRLRKPQ